MVEKTAENISLLVDNELDEHEISQLITEMSDDLELRKRWEHYHLISDACRNNLPNCFYPDLSTRISNALQSEPQHQHAPPVVIPFRSRFKHMPGLAIAASLVAMAMVVLLQINLNPEVVDGTNMPVVAESSISQPASTTAASSFPEPTIILAQEPQNFQNTDINELSTSRLAVDTRLQDYLLNHSEYSVSAPVQGAMLPYVRLVDHNVEQ